MSNFPVGIDKDGTIIHVQSAEPQFIKASELIRQLEEMKAMFGDLPVYFDDDHVDTPIEYVIVKPQMEEKEPFAPHGVLNDRFVIC